jgi:uncharacterized protein YecE (DUF72 family)
LPEDQPLPDAHEKLRDPEEPLERFFEVFEPMNKLMGPLLVQLPRMVKFNYDVADHFFSVLKKSYKKYEFVLEPRHNTWFETDALTLLANIILAWLFLNQAKLFHIRNGNG